MTSIKQTLINLLATNQIFQGGVVVASLGFLFTYFKTVPSRIYNFIKNRIIFSVEITTVNSFNDNISSTQEVYDAVMNKVKKMTEFKRNRKFKLITRPSFNDIDEKTDVRIFYVPLIGINWFKYNGTWIVVDTNIGELNSNQSGNSTQLFEKSSLNVSCLTFKKSKENLQQFITDAWNEYNDTYDGFLKVKTLMSAGYWGSTNRTLPRKLETVFNSEIDIIKNDLTYFLSQKKWYEDRQIQHQRGILLYGPPGNGKTSLLRGIATEFGLTVYVVRCSELVKMTDKEFEYALMQIGNRGFIVIEDVDSLFEKSTDEDDEDSTDDVDYEIPQPTSSVARLLGRKLNTRRKNLVGNSLTLSGLLNGLDGIMQSNSSRIVCMTTNKIDSIDYAVRRSGRIDREYYIGNATKENIRKMYMHFFPEALTEVVDEFVDKYQDGAVPMAQIQEDLMKEKERIDILQGKICK